MSRLKNNNLSVEAHIRVGKTKSDSADVDQSPSNDRNGGCSNIVRSSSGALVEGVRDVQLISDGYRRSVDCVANIQPSAATASLDSVHNGQVNEFRAQERAGDGENEERTMIARKHPYERGINISTSDGTRKSVPSSHSPGTSGLARGYGHSSAVGLQEMKHDGGNEASSIRRGSVGEGREQGTDPAAGVPLRGDIQLMRLTLPTGTIAAHTPLSVAPYHMSRNVVNFGGRQLSPTSQQPPVLSQLPLQRQHQQQQQQNVISRPTAFVRLTRNGPFCPCFSPNDSDTEPSSPTGDNAVTQPPSVPSRNMASLARELRARFVTGHSRSQPTSAAFSAHQRNRASAAETMHMVAEPYPVHTQVEYTHYLVPDLMEITRAPYYWGVMDRFEAERLLDNQPEGTFLLRDSAQSEYLFSVSFRRYNRTLHARIEQLNHRFSFDSYDQDVFSAETVTELIEHYKDPSKFLFFEPQLSLPLPRNFVFPLQHICRAVIANNINYNDINRLELPKKFKDYLREYHYKHPVRVTKLD